MNPFKQAVKQTAKTIGSNAPSSPYAPIRTVGETTLNNLPVLTEVATAAEAHRLRTLNAEETQQFLQQLERHLETLFTQKLSLRLEQLQRQSIDQALDELKAELPELLRDALHAHLESR